MDYSTDFTLKVKYPKYRALVVLNYASYHLGHFDTLEEANIICVQFRLRHMPFSEEDKKYEILPEYDFLNDLSNLYKIHKKGYSQYYGVSKIRGGKRWTARCLREFIGNFSKEKHAAYAHDTYLRIYEPDNTKYLNFPDIHLSIEEIEKLKFEDKVKTTSKYLGVAWDKNRNKWRAYFTVNDKTKEIGRFDNEKVASIARDIAVFNHYGYELPQRMKFNHPDLFNEDTLTWANYEFSNCDIPFTISKQIEPECNKEEFQC